MGVDKLCITLLFKNGALIWDGVLFTSTVEIPWIPKCNSAEGTHPNSTKVSSGCNILLGGVITVDKI